MTTVRPAGRTAREQFVCETHLIAAAGQERRDAHNGQLPGHRGPRRRLNPTPAHDARQAARRNARTIGVSPGTGGPLSPAVAVDIANRSWILLCSSRPRSALKPVQERGGRPSLLEGCAGPCPGLFRRPARMVIIDRHGMKDDGAFQPAVVVGATARRQRPSAAGPTGLVPARGGTRQISDRVAAHDGGYASGPGTAGMRTLTHPSGSPRLGQGPPPTPFSEQSESAAAGRGSRSCSEPTMARGRGRFAPVRRRRPRRSPAGRSGYACCAPASPRKEEQS